MKQHLNHSVGILLVLPLLVFFFYKSIESSNPYATLSAVTEEIETHQARLHRDLVRYRDGRIQQYDTLNRTAQRLSLLGRDLAAFVTPGQEDTLALQLGNLQNAIAAQSGSIEDFKTANAVFQNALLYCSRLHAGLRADENGFSSPASADLLGKLSFLLLEYARQPGQKTALEIYPLLDQLNTSRDIGTRTLVNHALIIMDRLPNIDAIIETDNAGTIEKQVAAIETALADHRDRLEQHNLIYNSLLFFSGLYLLGYLGYMLLLLKRNRDNLVGTNKVLHKEIESRTETEKTLYRLARETASLDDEDFIRGMLHALYTALGYRYPYLSLAESQDGTTACIPGLVDNGNYLQDIDYSIAGSPCEEVMREGRLVHNRDFKNYFPGWDNSHIPFAESFIGITIRDHDDRVTGMLAVADDRPIINSNLAENILALAASRISTELLRRQALQDRERFHTGLQSIDSKLAGLIGSAGDTSAFYRTVCEAVLDIAEASMAFVAIVDEPADTYTIVAACGSGSERLRGARHGLDDGSLVSCVVADQGTIRVDDVDSDMRARRQQINSFSVESACITPVFLNDSIHGAIAVFRKAASFDPVDEQLIHQFTQRAQLALANVKLVSAIAAEKERAELTLHSIGDAVITTDAEGRIDYMNPIAQHLTGWQIDAAVLQPVHKVFRILDQLSREPEHNVIDACLAEGTASNKRPAHLVNRKGNERVIERSVSPIVDASGTVEGAVIVFHDETERRRMACIIQHQATHDMLTGLVNRRQFTVELDKLVEHAGVHQAEHVLCYIGLDRFKAVNDTCGHAAGDELLKQLAAKLHATIRAGDILARLGGDEFGLLLQNCPAGAAMDIADKIVTAVAEKDFIWEGQTFTVGASIGIAPMTADTTDANEVMQQADLACSTAKQQGRNRAVLYDQEDTALVRRQEAQHWASLISNALEQDRFRLYAQTICPLDRVSDNAAHIEILVRMEGENGQLIPPSAFIPAAERYNLMAAVDRHIIRQTFSFMAEHAREGVCVSINLSGNSLRDSTLSAFIQECASDYRIRPNLVCLEINEAAAIAALGDTRELVSALKPAGFRFALDDFGRQLSSFDYLQHLPVDYIKIDGSFVREMVDNPIDHGMVAAINQVGQIMEIQTIAESVENEQIVTRLRALGVDFAQGYGVARPAPLDATTLKNMTRHATFSNGLASAS